MSAVAHVAAPVTLERCIAHIKSFIIGDMSILIHNGGRIIVGADEFQFRTATPYRKSVIRAAFASYAESSFHGPTLDPTQSELETYLLEFVKERKLHNASAEMIQSFGGMWLRKSKINEIMRAHFPDRIIVGHCLDLSTTPEPIIEEPRSSAAEDRRDKRAKLTSAWRELENMRTVVSTTEAKILDILQANGVLDVDRVWAAASIYRGYIHDMHAFATLIRAEIDDANDCLKAITAIIDSIPAAFGAPKSSDPTADDPFDR